MIIWLNGPFGVGKTTTAEQLCRPGRGLRVFDPEEVGYLVRRLLPDVLHDDFQDLAPWRSLVPRVAAEMSRCSGEALVAVQTVLVQQYWEELATGLAAEGLDTFHVLLDCEADELRRRARRDLRELGARRWRLDHIQTYEDARSWMTQSADLVVDTTAVSAAKVAEQIWAAVQRYSGGDRPGR